VGPVRAWGAVSNLDFELRRGACEFQNRPVLLRNTFTAGKIFLAPFSWFFCSLMVLFISDVKIFLEFQLLKNPLIDLSFIKSLTDF